MITGTLGRIEFGVRFLTSHSVLGFERQQYKIEAEEDDQAHRKPGPTSCLTMDWLQIVDLYVHPELR